MINYRETNLSISIKYITVFILNFLVLSSALGQEITPKYFYTGKLSQCILKYGLEDISISNSIVMNNVREVIGFDWRQYHSENSNSLTVKHDLISKSIMNLNSSMHNAVVKNNLEEIKIGVDLLYQIAEKNTLLNTSTVNDNKIKGSKCYRGNFNNKSKCRTHESQYAMIFASHYIISAIYVKENIKVSQFQIIDDYIKKIYFNYIKLWTNQNHKYGFNEMGNGAIGSISYANWINDRDLGLSVFKNSFNQIDRLFLDDGYINNNSFRGVRAIFYHSLGLNSALGLIALSNAWDIDVPEKILNKIKKSAEILNLGLTDYKKFKSRQFFGYKANSSLNPKYIRKNTHPNAISIDFLMSKYLDVNLTNDYEWFKSKQKNHNDLIIGFDANCLFLN